MEEGGGDVRDGETGQESITVTELRESLKWKMGEMRKLRTCKQSF